ncbi:MAG: cytochrome c3 family protein [Deltaproteobacteria bacterium]|nr:cytochrome c3 family protein [Deltaproteobacteria bacterium]
MGVFKPRANTIMRVVFVAVLLAPVALVTGLLLYARSPFFTNQGFQVLQPVQLDHRHHAADDGIDCRYCHDSVTVSPSAGIPSTETCMGCHSQIWNTSPLLEPVRRSYFEGGPIRWQRVHQVPDFVYFNHAIHVGKGIGCISCHGRVDQMPVVEQVATLAMEWCLACHRDPVPQLRPPETIASMSWSPPPNVDVLRRELAERYGVRNLTDCYTCHR